jgi:drug/metabolite transporter (DMT)-like permease
MRSNNNINNNTNRGRRHRRRPPPQQQQQQQEPPPPPSSLHPQQQQPDDGERLEPQPEATTTTTTREPEAPFHQQPPPQPLQPQPQPPLQWMGETAPLLDSLSAAPVSHRKARSVDFAGLGLPSAPLDAASSVPHVGDDVGDDDDVGNVSDGGAKDGSSMPPYLFQRPQQQQRQQQRRQRLAGLHRKQAHSYGGGGFSDSMRELLTAKVLRPIQEDLSNTAHQVKRAFVSELDRMDHGDAHGGYLDFSMTRSLSILPEDLNDLAEDILSFLKQEEKQQQEQQVEGEDKERLPLISTTTSTTTATATTATAHDADSANDNAIPAPFWQYFGLVLAVLAVSSNATALHMLVGVPPPMKLYWRMTTSWCVLLVFAIRSLWKDRQRRRHRQQHQKQQKQQQEKQQPEVVGDGIDDDGTTPTESLSSSSSPSSTSLLPTMTVGMWLTFLAAVVCYSIHALLFIMALEYTAIGNALIFANSQALLLIIGKACVGERIHILEGMGVIIAFCGAILCSTEQEKEDGTSSGLGAGVGDTLTLDTTTTTTTTTMALLSATHELPVSSSYMNEHGETNDDAANAAATNAILGDAMALGSALFGVGYLTFAKAVRSQLPVTVFLFSVMLVGSTLVLLYMMLTMHHVISFTMDPETGVFGWLNPERLPILLFLAIVVNCVGTMGFVRGMYMCVCMHYYYVVAFQCGSSLFLSWRRAPVPRISFQCFGGSFFFGMFVACSARLPPPPSHTF